MRALFSRPNYLSKAPPPNTTMLDLTSTHEFWGNIEIQSIFTFYLPFTWYWMFELLLLFGFMNTLLWIFASQLCADKCFNFFAYIPRTRIVGSCSWWMFNFLRNHQTIFQSSSAISHSCQWCMRVPISLHPHQHLGCPSLDFSPHNGYASPLFSAYFLPSFLTSYYFSPQFVPLAGWTSTADIFACIKSNCWPILSRQIVKK